MGFVNKYKDFLVGSSLTNTSQAIFYNLNTKLCSVLNIPGECVREIIPFDDMLMYFSHELNNTKTFLYVVTMTSAEIISKIPVPNIDHLATIQVFLVGLDVFILGHVTLSLGELRR